MAAEMRQAQRMDRIAGRAEAGGTDPGAGPAGRWRTIRAPCGSSGRGPLSRWRHRRAIRPARAPYAARRSCAAVEGYRGTAAGRRPAVSAWRGAARLRPKARAAGERETGARDRTPARGDALNAVERRAARRSVCGGVPDTTGTCAAAGVAVEGWAGDAGGSVSGCAAEGVGPAACELCGGGGAEDACGHCRASGGDAAPDDRRG